MIKENNKFYDIYNCGSPDFRKISKNNCHIIIYWDFIELQKIFYLYYYFPSVTPKNNIFINIYNERKYLACILWFCLPKIMLLYYKNIIKNFDKNIIYPIIIND